MDSETVWFLSFSDLVIKTWNLEECPLLWDTGNGHRLKEDVGGFLQRTESGSVKPVKGVKAKNVAKTQQWGFFDYQIFNLGINTRTM